MNMASALFIQNSCLSADPPAYIGKEITNYPYVATRSNLFPYALRVWPMMQRILYFKIVIDMYSYDIIDFSVKIIFVHFCSALQVALSRSQMDSSKAPSR